LLIDDAAGMAARLWLGR